MNNIQSELKLRDLGERRILREIIYPRFSSFDGQIVGIGDDCAILPSPPIGHALVVTTDPCPTPVVCMVERPDMYHYGRMTILINVSDLAAMGAQPLGIVVSTVMPEDMSVREFDRFLDGISDAADEWSCPVLGGNIKDGPEFTSTGTAIGSVEPSKAMRRFGARVGDHVLVIGEMGLFWAAVLTRIENGAVTALRTEILDNALYRPVAKLAEGRALAGSGSVTACMDSSDGVIGCLQELAAVNRMDIIVNSRALAPHPDVAEVAASAEIDPRKLMLSWGNWELVCAVRPEQVSTIKNLMASLGTKVSDIGEVSKGKGNVLLLDGDRHKRIRNFASERFCPTSTFTHGLGAYLDFLRKESLTED